MVHNVLTYINYTFNDPSGKEPDNKPEANGHSITFPYPCNDTNTCFPYSVSFQPGHYLFELWGAQGGNSRYVNTINIIPDSGGKGAYVRGSVRLSESKTFYLYIGGRGGDNWQINSSSHGIGGYNGGKDGGADLSDIGYNFPLENSSLEIAAIPESSAGGGGATDIRLEPGLSKESLVSRIIIAAGGGGGASTSSTDLTYVDYRGGHGGGLESSVFNIATKGASQTGDLFGEGSEPLSIQEGNGGSIGGGGGGYFGGYSIQEYNSTYGVICAGGPGGSSYISGYDGCNSVKLEEYGNISNIINTNSSTHVSGIIFYNSKMVPGREANHTGSGEIKITFLRPLIITININEIQIPHEFLFMFIFSIKK